MSDISFVLLYVENVAGERGVLRPSLGRPALESSPTFAMLPAAPGLMLGLWRRDDVAPKANARRAAARSPSRSAERSRGRGNASRTGQALGVANRAGADADGFRLHLRRRSTPTAIACAFFAPG